MTTFIGQEDATKAIIFSNKPNSWLFVIDEDKEPGENGQKTDPNWQVLLAS